MSEDNIDKIIRENSRLAEYRFFLEGYARFNPYIFSEEAETVSAELGIKELHFHANYVPLVDDVDKEYSYEETINLMSLSFRSGRVNPFRFPSSPPAVLLVGVTPFCRDRKAFLIRPVSPLQ